MDNLLIAVDPGFDSMKVVIDDIVFKFPFNVEKTNESKFSNFVVSGNFYLYQDGSLGTWRVGEYARELVFENKAESEIEDKMASFYSEDRFLTEDFQIGIKTAIGLALIKYSKKTDISLLSLLKSTILLMVTLPHASRERYSGTVKESLKGTHQFSLKIGDNDFQSFKFDLEESNIHTISQTIASVIGETSDDDGNINEEKFHYLSQGPTLVIDGGYYSTGLVSISRGGSIDNNKSESNTDFTMKAINTRVADELQPIRSDIKHYVIEYLESKDQGSLKYIDKETNKAKRVDILQVKEEKTKEICDEFIEYLNSKYSNLLDYNYVLLTGGASSRYYEHIRDYYISNEILSDESLMIADSVLYGQAYSIEYAIVIGAYRSLKGKVS